MRQLKPKKNKLTLWVALSGGHDSVALLHLVKTHQEAHSNLYQLQAIHVNHHLLEEAHDFQKHCQTICRQFNIPLKIVDIDCHPKPGESLEAKAREERYSAIKKQLKINDLLITAHHQDDQAETVLLQILRGAGIKGTSAMPEITSFGKGFLLRPLLHFSREQIRQYCQAHHLKGCEDPSNQDQSFDRNFLRAQIFPRLNQHWPKASKIFARFAKHCAEQVDLLEDFSQKDFDHCFDNKKRCIKLYKLTLFSSSRQKNILRRWIYQRTHFFPTEKILKTLLSFPEAKHDKNPQVKINDYECHRFLGALWLLHSHELNSRKNNTLTKEEQDWCKSHIKNWSSLQPTLAVRFRQGGEKITLTKDKHHKTLKNLFQEWQIPPWQRNQIPLIFLRQTLIAVVGYAVGKIVKE